MKHLLSSVAVLALVVGAPALAISKDGANKAKQQQQTQATQPASIEFVRSQSSSEWLGSTIVGAAVKNQQGETLGDINNVILSENGEITTVVIGVGGFLGIGEKDVGVRFSALKISTYDPAKDKDKSAKAKDNKQVNKQAMAKDADKNKPAQDKYQDKNKQAASKDQTMAKDQAMAKDADQNKSDKSAMSKDMSKDPHKTMNDKTADRTAPPPRNTAVMDSKTDKDYDDQTAAQRHGDVVIILNASKKQLEDAPEFAYLGEEERRADAGTDSKKKRN